MSASLEPEQFVVSKFLERVDLTCVICHTVHTDVVELSCGHIFGKNCLEKCRVVGGERRCPSCRKAISKPLEVSIFLKRTIMNQKIRCRHAPDCTWEGTIKQNHMHIKQCPEEVISCSKPGCNHKVKRKDMAVHEAETVLHWKAASEHMMAQLKQQQTELRKEHEKHYRNLAAACKRQHDELENRFERICKRLKPTSLEIGDRFQVREKMEVNSGGDHLTLETGKEYLVVRDDMHYPVVWVKADDEEELNYDQWIFAEDILLDKVMLVL